MTFTSLAFLLFLFGTLLLYYLLPPKARSAVLLFTSCLFYALYNWRLLPFLLFFTLLVYIGGVLLENRKTRLLIALGILVLLVPLLIFKYLNFGLELLVRIFDFLEDTFLDQQFSIIQPLGISYFTFKSIGYLIDVYRGRCRAERNFVDLAVFVSFFPEMLIGPIDRASTLLPQIKAPSTHIWSNLKTGFLLFLGGCVQKMVVADRLAVLVNTVYSDLYRFEGFEVLIAVIAYSLQIYFDFSGCTYMALGVGKMLGLSLPVNFRQPYLAVSVEDFWHRWHISLTSWFRDYIYIPLGGNRKGTLRKYLNVMIVFLVSGLWHGAGASFLVWGGLNGLFQIIGTLLRGQKSKLYSLFRISEEGPLCVWWKRLWTFGWMTIAWVFFRSSGISQALLVFRKLVAAWNPWILFDGTLYTLGLSQKSFCLLLGALLIMLAVELLHERDIHLSAWFNRQHFAVKCLITYGMIFVILIFGIYGSAYDAQSFIYLQF